MGFFFFFTRDGFECKWDFLSSQQFSWKAQILASKTAIKKTGIDKGWEGPIWLNQIKKWHRVDHRQKEN